MNAGETFQRAMDLAFVGERYEFFVIYFDDLIVFYNYDVEHMKHLRKTFDKCKNMVCL